MLRITGWRRARRPSHSARGDVRRDVNSMGRGLGPIEMDLLRSLDVPVMKSYFNILRLVEVLDHDL